MKIDIDQYSLVELQEAAAKKKAELKMPKPLQKPDFYELQCLITEGVEEMAKNEHEDGDFCRYVYEAAIEAVYGKRYWEWRNNVSWDE
jgi:hypothetical protein